MIRIFRRRRSRRLVERISHYTHHDHALSVSAWGRLSDEDRRAVARLLKADGGKR